MPTISARGGFRHAVCFYRRRMTKFSAIASAPTKLKDSDRILVVDASEAHVRDVVATLGAAGFSAVGTTDPWEAITLASRHSLSLILLDMDLTRLGGADFCSLVVDDPGLQSVPTIFFARDGEFPSLPRESDVCLPKPLDPASLLAAVRKLLVWPFPPEETPEAPTRFIRRRRPPQPAGML
jgi:CheY-like chemotaxis protein